MAKSTRADSQTEVFRVGNNYGILQGLHIVVRISILALANPPSRFTRGWTLQELIAPANVTFFDSQWKARGNKTSLATELSTITNIDVCLLEGSRSLEYFSVAQRMSWAASRVTTRIEDTAYCLMGLFDINMPLLYGEEEKAFRRLQEEIIRSTTDLSIFAWKFPPLQDMKADILRWTSWEDANFAPIPSEEGMLCGILAKSPAVFFGSGECKSFQRGGPRELSVTNIGIKTRARIIIGNIGVMGIKRYFLPLNCMSNDRYVCVVLR